VRLTYQLYKIAAAGWITFVLVYLPLVLVTGTFTLVPDTFPEIAVLVAGAFLGGIGPHGPPNPFLSAEEREWKGRAKRRRTGEPPTLLNGDQRLHRVDWLAAIDDPEFRSIIESNDDPSVRQARLAEYQRRVERRAVRDESAGIDSADDSTGGPS
jgi:hypothetical protein